MHAATFIYSRKVHHAPQVTNLAFLGIPLENPLEKFNVENFREKRLGFIAKREKNTMHEGNPHVLRIKEKK